MRVDCPHCAHNFLPSTCSDLATIERCPSCRHEFERPGTPGHGEGGFQYGVLVVVLGFLVTSVALVGIVGRFSFSRPHHAPQAQLASPPPPATNVSIPPPIPQPSPTVSPPVVASPLPTPLPTEPPPTPNNHVVIAPPAIDLGPSNPRVRTPERRPSGARRPQRDDYAALSTAELAQAYAGASRADGFLIGLELAKRQPNDSDRAEVMQAMIHRLESEIIVDHSASAIIAAWASPDDVPALLKLLDTRRLTNKREIYNVIAKHGDASTAEALVKRYRDHRDLDALEALKQLGTQAEDAVWQAYNASPTSFESGRLLRVLREIGTKTTLDRLKNRLQGLPQFGSDRFEIEAAIRAIEGRGVR